MKFLYSRHCIVQLLVPVNKRVLNYAIGDGTEMYKSDIAVTQDKPMSAKK